MAGTSVAPSGLRRHCDTALQLLLHVLHVIIVAVFHLIGEVANGSLSFVLSIIEPGYYGFRRKRISAGGATSPHGAVLAAGNENAARRQVQFLNRQAAGYIDELKLAALHAVEACITRARAFVTGQPVALLSPGAAGRAAAGAAALSPSSGAFTGAPPSPGTSLPAALASAPVPRPPRSGKAPAHPAVAASRASASCAMVEAMLGIPAQVYVVRTVDGYLLTLVRLPRKESSRVAFFQHGLLDSASAWVSTGDRHSLASRARGAWGEGFDVFLGNLRGSNDALGTNGMEFGANPVDYDEQDGADEAEEAEEAQAGAVRAGLRTLARMVKQAAAAATGPSAGAAEASRRRAASDASVSSAGAATTKAQPVAAGGSDVDGAATLASEAPLRGRSLVASFSRNNSSLSLGEALGSASTSNLLALDTSIAELDDDEEEEEANGDGDDAASVARSAVSRVSDAGALLPPAYVASADGIPVHESLSPRQPAYWDFNVLDHVLDVMAFIRVIRSIKASERGERDSLKAAAAAAAAAGSGLSGRPLSRMRREGSSPALTKSGVSLDSLAAAAAAEFTAAATGGGQQEGAESTGAPPAAAQASSAHAHASHHHAHTHTQQQHSQQPAPAAASAAADDTRIVFCGHSMGGAIGLLYVMTTKALGRPTWVDRLVLLSPAGLHREIALPMRAALQVMSRGGFVRGHRPFPARSSRVQRSVARLLQDLKRGAPSSDLMVWLAGRFFGGPGQWVRSVSLSNYPLGGSSCGVVRHGVACIDNADFVAPPHGSGAANAARYGTPELPSFRRDFGLLLGTPVHLVAGGRDHLVPACNVFETHSLLCAISAKYAAATSKPPGATGDVTVKLFPESGHLDFTLSLGDDIVSHVLSALEGKETAPPIPALSPAPYPTHSSLLSPAVQAVVEATATAAVARQLDREAAAAQASAASGGKGTATGGGGWRPARVAAVQFPWLKGFTKLDLVLDGLDQEARDMGLPAAQLFI